jgi:flagellar biosynthetic protein FliR
VTIMLYLALNVHLSLLSALADSFTTMPISDLPMSTRLFEQITAWGGKIFSAGVQLALPIVAAMLITNIGLSVLARSAPQLNLFGIGFPITLTVGFVMLAVVVPYMGEPLTRLFQDGMEMMQMMTKAVPVRPG